jgi:hypothetical protein
MPERLEREPTIEDVRQLMGASTPHFALHIRNRLRTLISALPPDHPARRHAEPAIRRLEGHAVEGEHRGMSGQGEPELPSIRRA